MVDASHSHAHVYDNPPLPFSHLRCLSVRPLSRTRTCPRYGFVSSGGSARFPCILRANMESLAWLFPPGSWGDDRPGDRPGWYFRPSFWPKTDAFYPTPPKFYNNRTSSRMPWTAPPRYVSLQLSLASGVWHLPTNVCLVFFDQGRGRSQTRMPFHLRQRMFVDPQVSLMATAIIRNRSRTGFRPDPEHGHAWS